MIKSHLFFVLENTPRTARLRDGLEKFIIYNFTNATHALEAAHARKFKIDLLIADAGTNGLNGIALMHKFHQHAEIPVILLGPPDAEIEELALKSGAADYQSREISAQMLAQRASTLLASIARITRHQYHHPIDSTPSQYPPAQDEYADGVLELTRAGICHWRGKRVHLNKRQIGVLFALVSRPGALVDQDTLLRMAYPDKHVSKDSITGAIRQIRAAVRAVDRTGIPITTLYGGGYKYEPPKA
ncbi:MAG: response regulator transcription factor [Rhodospirillales bacterium]|nr:response regulator transcription factor [Alphaproteobacteria bacterium]MCB9986690.1 response regulator transcription factor [Rhodospirillales bacterium]USO06785.1 MAG: response regulator transcription factor [Rhodospirillales bacterium]